LGGALGIWFLLRALPEPRVRRGPDALGAPSGQGALRGPSAPRSPEKRYDEAAVGQGDPDAAGARPRAWQRRAVLRMAGLGAVASIAAGVLSRLVPSIADVRANREAVTLPPVRRPGGAGAAGARSATSAPSPGG